MINQLKRVFLLILVLLLLPYSTVFAFTEQQSIIQVNDYDSYVETIKQSILTNQKSITIKIDNYDSNTFDYKKAINQLKQDSPEVCFLLDRSSSGGQIIKNTATLVVSFSYKHTKEELNEIIQANNYNDYYMAMKNALQNFNDKIIIKIINYNSTEYESSNTLTQILNNFNDVRYGIKGTSTSTHGEGKDKILEVTFNYLFSKDTMIKMKEKVNEKSLQIINEVIKPGMQDYEKEIVLHDYLVNHSKYDSINYERNTVPAEGHTAYGVLIQGTGVCEGYAEAMRKLLTSAGIECRVVTGYGNNEPHAWNIVKIQNQYYMLDATWDDPVSSKDILSHEYFNVTDAKMGQNHQWVRNLLPKCTNTDYSYDNIIKVLNNSNKESETSSKEQTEKVPKDNIIKQPDKEEQENATKEPDKAPKDNNTGKTGGESKEKKEEKEEFGIQYIRNSIALFIDNPEAYVKGVRKAIDINNLDVVPVVVDGNTLVPARFIAESFGAEVEWDEATSHIIIKYGSSQASLTLGSDIMYLNGREVSLSVPAQTVNNRTMVPLRRLAEDLIGKKVFYEDDLIVIGDEKNVSDLLKDETDVFFVRELFTCTERLEKEDISFTVDGKTYFFNHPEAETLFKQMGTGNADENNNYGFVGWDNDYKYKTYRNGYPAKSPEVYVYSKMNVTDDTTEITDIDISRLGTTRGLKVGDSYNKMTFTYEAPYDIVDLGEGKFMCLYAYYNRTRLAFYFNSSTRCITGIKIIFID